MASSLKSLYLILYNCTFTALWLTLLLRIVALEPLSSYQGTYSEVGEFAKWIQTAALLEVVHAAIGRSKPVESPVASHVACQILHFDRSSWHVFTYRTSPRSSGSNLHSDRCQKSGSLDYRAPISGHRSLARLYHPPSCLEYRRNHPVWVFHTHAFWIHFQSYGVAQV